MIAEQLEAKYTLFESIDKMLAPETLSELLSQSVRRVKLQPITQHGGVAGGYLSYVDTNAGRLVLKRMSLEHDWLMFATDDRKCRSVRLWQYGLLDQIRPHLEHKILACGRENGNWGILMEDLTGQVYRDDTPMPSNNVLVFLDRLARLHAAFWGDVRLKYSQLGLNGIANRLNVTSPAFAQNYNGDQWGVVPGWVREGWQIMKTQLDPDVYAQIENLHENPQPIIAALNRYPYTLLHGDYASRNLAHADHPVAFDW